MVDTTLTSLLRTSMSRAGARDHVTPTSQLSLELPVDTVKVRVIFFNLEQYEVSKHTI